MGLKLTYSKSPSMASPQYKVSSKSMNRFKRYLGGGGQTDIHADRQYGDLIRPFFILSEETRMKKKLIISRVCLSVRLCVPN
jgi:hypothetical protein